jgi:intracellular sulfur oxidation DsrE/DsrF family protein
MPRLATFFLILVLLPASTVAQPQIEHLLDAQSEPDGVVFEILEEDEDALTWALPLIRQLAERLRTRFPELPITVVSHGSEQFALLAAASEGPLAEIHDEARDLAASQIELHVCGAHAGWYGYGADDFPDHIDVAASAPALINDYRALGYEIVRLRQPDS